jgi:fatty-acyl-CoA synthase
MRQHRVLPCNDSIRNGGPHARVGPIDSHDSPFAENWQTSADEHTGSLWHDARGSGIHGRVDETRNPTAASGSYRSPTHQSPTHNVGVWIERRAAAGGDRTACTDAERTLDYAALHDRTLRCAGWLATAGIEPGDRVALLLDNRSAYLEAVFAAARLGAIAVPINARFTAPEVLRVLDDCTPKVLLHEATLAPVADRACAKAAHPPRQRLACGGAPDAYEAALADVEPLGHLEPVAPEDPMLLLYTSGTTGVPKGALLPHRKTLFNSLNAQLFFDLTRNDRVLVPLPLFHSFGLLILSLPTLYVGGTVHLMPKFDAAGVWRAVERERITFLGGVPTLFQALLEALEVAQADGTPTPAHKPRFLFSAGAAISVELIRSFEKRGYLVKQGFGQTETSILCCLDARDAIRKAGSVGRAVFHAELRLIDVEALDRPVSQWRDVDVDCTGEIVVRGPITFLGYWERPDATAETLRDGWVRTGDLATIDAEGFVTLIGRARDMYISGGENVYPAEIEAVFSKHPAIREIAVVGAPHPKWGETGLAYIVPTDGKEVDVAAFEAWGAERLARFKLPTRFVTTDSLPRTPSGKVQKHRLPKPPS